MLPSIPVLSSVKRETTTFLLSVAVDGIIDIEEQIVSIELFSATATLVGIANTTAASEGEKRKLTSWQQQSPKIG
jgi:hypothetical protein